MQSIIYNSSVVGYVLQPQKVNDTIYVRPNRSLLDRGLGWQSRLHANMTVDTHADRLQTLIHLYYNVAQGVATQQTLRIFQVSNAGHNSGLKHGTLSIIDYSNAERCLRTS